MNRAESWIRRTGDGLLEEGFVWPELPTLMNAAGRTHHRVWAEKVAYWRERFREMGDGCPPLQWCEIVVTHEKRLSKLPDIGGCMPSYKAALDGLVAAGVIADDGPAYVRRLSFLPPEHTGRDALTLILVGPPAD